MGRRLALVAVIALAAAIRLLHWAAVRDEPFVAELVMDSAEYDRWARAIVAGEPEPASYFQPPLYPWLLAGVYAVTGGSTDAMYLLQILLALAGCWALYRAGATIRDARLGLAAAALYAVYPTFVFHDVQLLKESLAVTLVAFLLWALVTAWQDGGWMAWAAAGASLGTLALLRENLLLVVPLLALLALRPRAGVVAVATRVAAFLGALVLPLVPVALHNAAGTGSLLPTTFQGGVNFWIGNHPGADGTYQPVAPGRQVPSEERRQAVRLAEQGAGRELSPAEVSRWWLARSLAWARADPAAFAALQLRKLRLFWSWYEWPDAVDFYYLRLQSPVLRAPWPGFGAVTLLAVLGLALVRRDLGRWLPVLLWCAGAMAATVAFFLFSRYRLPVLPALMLLAAVPLRQLADAQVGRRAGLALATAVIVALALPTLARHEPRWDLVHANLGMLHQQRGRLDLAARAYADALGEAPESSDLWLKLGTVAARSGRLAAARECFARAARIDPSSDIALANLGAANLALGDVAEARRHLEQALALDPTNVEAQRNLALLLRRHGPASHQEAAQPKPSRLK